MPHTATQPFTLNEKTRRTVESAVGLPYGDILRRSAGELTRHIEKKVGHRLRPGFSAGKSLVGRGSAYLFLRRLFGKCR